jgi:NAD(P) transhydrogenase
VIEPLIQSYDLAVIGTGPAGHFGAIQAAKLGKKVVAIEARERLGGAAAITGTIPSKALREATLHLTGLRQRTFYGMHYRVKDDLTVEDLTRSTAQTINLETAVLEAQLRRNGVEILRGVASFLNPHQLQIVRDGMVQVINAEKFLVAVGSSPTHPPGMDFDGHYVLDSRQILELNDIPQSMTVVGAGVIGMEYACIFAALGTKVTIVNQSERFLEFVDREVIDNLMYHMRARNCEFRVNEEVLSVERREGGVVVRTQSNKEIWSERVLYSIGRQGSTANLHLDAARLEVDERNRIPVNDNYQTSQGHIYAAGDVIGFPALAATSREQGARASAHAFGAEIREVSTAIPYGIYAIPEISMFGPTEEELTLAGTPYQVGRARYREIARGQILGDVEGMLKILFDPDSLVILAVHIIGEGATELIHIGQAVHAFGGTLTYFVDGVLNYPTLAECYKVAALDGMNRVRRHGSLRLPKAV